MMANYSLVRGWIECSYKDIKKIEKIVSFHKNELRDYAINSEMADLYWEGWSFPRKPLNWVSFVFYGANVNSLAIPFIKDCLIKIANSNLDLNGIFYLDSDEEDSLYKWVLSQGKFINSLRCK